MKRSLKLGRCRHGPGCSSVCQTVALCPAVAPRVISIEEILTIETRGRFPGHQRGEKQLVRMVAGFDCQVLHYRPVHAHAIVGKIRLFNEDRIFPQLVGDDELPGSQFVEFAVA